MANPDLSSGILGFAADSIETLRAEFDDFAECLLLDGLMAAIPHRLPVEGDDTQIPQGQVRLAIAYTTLDDLEARVGRAQKSLEKNRGWNLLENQGIYLAEAPLGGQIAMLFPGQGTQYLGMLNDLRGRFPVVDRTIAESDAIMTPLLDQPLSDMVYPQPGVDEAEAFERLTQTEVMQPAVLTADIAMMRLLSELGINPAMVAGHSLGEYGACVAAGVMTFEEALRTVARRGTAMAEATPMDGDNGLMAGVPMGAGEVQAVLDTIDGYVVCANKNCSKQTIVAGLTEPVRQAVAKFEEMGKTVVLLPVSHAFHSRVVEAASEPLRRHLDTIDIRPPRTPILTNVTGDFYPRGPGVENEIRDLLSKQVAAPVEFIALIERMYASGARVFIEVGPKRAQTSFVADILEGRPHAATYTNHPKKGDVGSLFEALAQLWCIGAWDLSLGSSPNSKRLIGRRPGSA